MTSAWNPQPVESWDPIHNPSPADAHWSTSNFGEAMPGVVKPLGWSLWGPVAERAIRGAFYEMGALSNAELRQVDNFNDDPLNRTLNAFYGRVAGRVNFFCEMGDRLPGTSGAAIAEQILGALPPGIESRATRRRYPIVAVRFPATFVKIAGQLRRSQQLTDEWWRDGIDRAGQLVFGEAVEQFVAAARRFERNVYLDGVHALCSVQPIYDQLVKLVARAGMGDANAFMSGYGSHAESAVVEDLWLASRGNLAFEEVLRRHGYHGPNEGEISGVVWREDPTPLNRLLESYKENATQGVTQGEEERRAKRRALEKDLLASLPQHRRPGARLILRLARASVPLRGVGKAAFLQSLDMARAAARRIGELLALDGQLADREDVFFLTVDEITGVLPDDPLLLVARRRDRYDEYLKVTLPAAWQGMPVPVALSAVEPETSGLKDVILGIGASPGTVEGPVRVVLDPAADEVEPGEVLVAPTTDPSWAPVMYISQALVVDIGGALSHAAIVARELGIPCVVNTKDGTRVLRTGDICRVDGTTGEVQVLSRARGTQPLT